MFRNDGLLGVGWREAAIVIIVAVAIFAIVKLRGGAS